MTTIFTKATLAVMLGLGALAAAAPANAGDVDVDIRLGGHRHHRPVYDEPVYGRPRVVIQQPPIIVRPPPVVVVRPDYGRCSEGLALQRAYDQGVNRPYIAKIRPDRVVVQGKMRGMFVKMVFANVRGCPRF